MTTRNGRTRVTFWVALLAMCVTALSSGMAMAQAPSEVALRTNATYPGTITLAVDATDVTRGIFSVRQTLPIAQPGPLTLLYPQWLPGTHSPQGPIDKLAGLTISANGVALAWRRDPLNVYAYQLEVPAGVQTLDIRFQFVSPLTTAQGRVVTTPVMLNLQWHAVLLYPAGYAAANIRYDASVTLPAGWQFGTALEQVANTGATFTFATTDLGTLVDSPLFAGKYFKQIDLDPDFKSTGRVPFRLNMMADRADQLQATEAQLEPHRRLVKQAYALFGPGRFDHYDFLLGLSDSMGNIGLEHLRSSENNRGANYFTEWDATPSGRDLLAHELTHSWNGKFRRPAGLAIDNFAEPMQNELLWVYEGQTQYWGIVLAARSGLLTKNQAIEAMATVAANLDHRAGRAWRSVADTTYEPIISTRRPEPWRSWQRPEDYYNEGMLIWLDVDTLIREGTRGKKSLDDFARSFFQAEATGLSLSPYSFNDVVTTLNAVMPHDWSAFLRARVDTIGAKTPLDGVARAGYRLVYADERNEMQKSQEKRLKNSDFSYSLGLIVGEDKKLTEVLWDSPAFNAGLVTGTELIAVNNVSYDADGLRRAITDAKRDNKPIELLVKNGDRFRTISINYQGGLRYPRLERVAGTVDRLTPILSSRP